MNSLVTKMSKLGFLKFQFIIGALLMAAVVVGVPVGMLVKNKELMANPYVLGMILITMLLFGLLGYFLFIRPYFLYKKLPVVQAETDGQFLYIHTKKEAKIPLSSLADATVYAQLPYLLQKEFLYEFIIHMFSDKYGDLVLDVPGYGSYKMRFVANVQDVANNLLHFIGNACNI